MMPRQLILNRLTMSVVTLNLSTIALYAADPNSDLLNSLRNQDDGQVSGMVESGFSVTFEMRYQADLGDPGQGMATANCTMCWTAETLAIEKFIQYEAHPTYRPKPQNSVRLPDAKKQGGNYTVSRPIRKYALSNKSINDSLIEYEVYVISPDGGVVEIRPYSLLQKDLIGKKNSIFEFYQFRMATGRGFSEHLDEIQSRHTVAGLRSISAVGSFGPTFQGTWNMKLDPGTDNLARESVFTKSGSTSALITSTSAGLITAGGVKIAKSGTLKMADLKFIVEVANFAVLDDGDELFFTDIQNHLNAPLPSGSSKMIDLRGNEAARSRTR